jgi:hypothetical protein
LSEALRLGGEYGSILDKISQMFACRVVGSDMRSNWKAFKKRMVRRGRLNVTTLNKLAIERTSASRYLTFHKNQRSLATRDPVTDKPWLELAQEFEEDKALPGSRGCGTKCWTDRFLRAAMSSPTVLPAMEVVRDMLNHILLPRMKIPFKDEAADPTYVPRMLAQCHTYLKRVLEDAENGEFARLEKLFNTGMPKHILSDGGPADEDLEPDRPDDVEQEDEPEDEDEDDEGGDDGDEDDDEEGAGGEQEEELALDDESVADATAADEAVNALNRAGTHDESDLEKFEAVVELVKQGWTDEMHTAYVLALRMVGRCRLTVSKPELKARLVSKPELKARLVSALETEM